MATSSLYGTVSESTGLYGIGAASGGTYFEWFIFNDSATAPATPTGGSWSFSTNTGTAPSGWLNAPPASPTNLVWVSIAVVDSRSLVPLVWSIPGLMTGSGLPILTGSGAPSAGTGLNGQLYINTATTPQSMFNKQSGAWVQLTGATLYATAGANSNITSMSGLTGAVGTPDNIQFDTTATATIAKGNLRWNTTTNTLAFGIIDGTDEVNIGQQMFAYVTNADSVTINRGQPVYLFAATGNRASVKLASNVGDSTSAKTLGLASENIAPNAAGFVMTQGVLDKLNTNAFAEGATLYLGATPGTLTSTKPQAPNHLVYIGVVERSNAGNGQIYVKPQNGYELDELHDVRITSVANKNLLQYNAGTQCWENVAGPTGDVVGTTDVQTLTNKTISGSSNTFTNIPNSALVYDSVNINGVDFTLGNVQTIGADWILPSYAGNAGKVLTVNPSASDVQWQVVSGTGSVTSVNVSGGSTGLTTSGGPIVAAGTITLGGVLNLANGGTGATTAAGARGALGLGTAAQLNAGIAGGVATLDGGGTVPVSQLPAAVLGSVSYQGSWDATNNIPTLTSSVGTKGYYYVVSVAGSTNLNGVTDWKVGDWAIFNGSVWQKIDNTDAVTSVNGYTGAVVLSYTDVGAPSTTGINATGTWGINISGNATNVTGTVAVANGGTGATTASGARTNLGLVIGTDVPSPTGTGASGTWSINISGNAATATAAVTATSATTATTATNVSGGTANVTTLTASADSSFTSTGALLISKGTTAQQPGTPVTGMMRYNSTTNQFEGYSGASPAWKSIGGSALSNDTTTSTNLFPVFAAATSGTAENLYTSNALYLYKPSTGELSVRAPRASNGIVVNASTVNNDYTIAAGDNGMSAGPIAIAGGVTVTVSPGSVWTVI